MPEKPVELILQIWMDDKRSSYDGETIGTFSAYVYKVAERPGYEGDPTATLYSYQSGWARFAMSARYGNMTLHDGYSWGLDWGFRPEGDFVQVRDIDTYSKGLKKVDRLLEKWREEEGSAQTLGQEVIRVMRAIGIKKACWKYRNGVEGHGDFRDWRVVSSMEDIRYYIDSTIETCRRKQLDAQAA